MISRALERAARDRSSRSVKWLRKAAAGLLKDPPTVRRLLDQHVDEAQARARRGDIAKSTLLQLRSTARYLEPVLEDRLDGLTYAQVSSIRDACSPSTWNHVRKLLLALHRLGVREGLIDASATPAARHVPRARLKPRNVRLTPEEYRRILEALDEIEREPRVLPATCDAIRAILYTGARRREICELQVDEVDLDLRIITPGFRKGAERRYALNRPALYLFRRRLAMATGRWVFEGRRPDSPVRQPFYVWRRVLDRAGLEHFPIHGLRHAWVTTALKLGSVEQVRVAIGFSSETMTRRYGHLTVRDSLDLVDEVGEVIGGGK